MRDNFFVQWYINIMVFYSIWNEIKWNKGVTHMRGERETTNTILLIREWINTPTS